MTQTAVRAGAAVALSGLRKRFGEIRAVDGIDLVISPGEVVALLGPNGAGKSTTVDMLLGLSTPDGGRIGVFGKSPREAVVAGRISAMPQSGALLDDATVAETVGLIAALHREPMPVARALEQAGIADLAGRRCTKLSGGQQQRVRFALALVCDPDLLVLDEPTVAMDVETRRAFWQQMRAYRHRTDGVVRDALPGGGRGVRRPRGLRGGRQAGVAGDRPLGGGFVTDRRTPLPRPELAGVRQWCHISTKTPMAARRIG